MQTLMKSKHRTCRPFILSIMLTVAWILVYHTVRMAPTSGSQVEFDRAVAWRMHQGQYSRRRRAQDEAFEARASGATLWEKHTELEKGPFQEDSSLLRALLQVPC